MEVLISVFETLVFLLFILQFCPFLFIKTIIEDLWPLKYFSKVWGIVKS